jgi:hypothetical protein
MDDDVGDLERGDRTYGQQSGIAGPRPDEDDAPAGTGV